MLKVQVEQLGSALRLGTSAFFGSTGLEALTGGIDLLHPKYRLGTSPLYL